MCTCKLTPVPLPRLYSLLCKNKKGLGWWSAISKVHNIFKIIGFHYWTSIQIWYHIPSSCFTSQSFKLTRLGMWGDRGQAATPRSTKCLIQVNTRYTPRHSTWNSQNLLFKEKKSIVLCNFTSKYIPQLLYLHKARATIPIRTIWPKIPSN